MKTSREKILQSALQLFMSMNYERVSLEMVSRSVGLTKTGIFNYYPSKLDLFVDVADHFLFGLQDPARKFAPSDGTVIDFIEKYVDGVRRTMDEIVRLGNVRRELMPGKLANAGYFHLFQQVLFYYPDGRQKLHELMESEYELWCRAIRGGLNAANWAAGPTSRRPPPSSARSSSDSPTRCPSPTASTSSCSGSVSFIYMVC